MCNLHKILLDNNIEENNMWGYVARMGRKRWKETQV